MIMGTMSSAGKSLIAAGLCRVYARKGWKVLPFKAQNMSNNAAVCLSGGEIGRAQAVQAEAAGAEPDVRMNPVLLKPESDHGSQVIIRGKVLGSYSGNEYYRLHDQIWPAVTDSLDSLREEADLVIMEGAGSIAELNLRKSDLVNLAVARYAGAPCLLTGNIDLGGIFAQLDGSWWLLDPEDRKYLKGFIVNKFRGDVSLFQDGIRILSERSEGVPVIGVLPYLHEHGIPDEDAASYSEGGNKSEGAAEICVVRLPHISNFDDFDALKYEKNVRLIFTDQKDELARARAIILPGTKNTIGDLNWLKENGLADEILRLFQKGTPIIGICGGYQILGRELNNPLHLECTQEFCSGLGILPVVTELTERKTVTQTRMRVVHGSGFLEKLDGTVLDGYEIHSGQSVSSQPIFEIIQRNGVSCSGVDGAETPFGRCFGTYLHGIFGNDNFRKAWLESLGIVSESDREQERRRKSFDLLADEVEKNLNIPLIDQIIEKGIR